MSGRASQRKPIGEIERLVRPGRTGKLATRAGRRERIAELLIADAECSNATIATRAASDRKTVSKVRIELEGAGAIEPRMRVMRLQKHGGALSIAQPGNTRAMVHGLKTPGRDRRYGPLRDGFLVEYRGRFPGEDDDDLARAARLKALIAVDDLDVERYGAGTKRGRAVAKEMVALSSQLDRLVGRFRAKVRSSAQPEDELAAVVAEIHAARGNGGDDG